MKTGDLRTSVLTKPLLAAFACKIHTLESDKQLKSRILIEMPVRLNIKTLDQCYEFFTESIAANQDGLFQQALMMQYIVFNMDESFEFRFSGQAYKVAQIEWARQEADKMRLLWGYFQRFVADESTKSKWTHSANLSRLKMQLEAREIPTLFDKVPIVEESAEATCAASGWRPLLDKAPIVEESADEAMTAPEPALLQDGDLSWPKLSDAQLAGIHDEQLAAVGDSAEVVALVDSDSETQCLVEMAVPLPAGFAQLAKELDVRTNTGHDHRGHKQLIRKRPDGVVTAPLEDAKSVVDAKPVADGKAVATKRS